MIKIGALPEEPQVLRQVYGCFPSGVTALCALVEGVPAGLVASSFTSVSLDPPLASVCIQDGSKSWSLLRGRPRLGLSVLAEQHDRACRTLSSTGADRFKDVAWEATLEQAVYIEGSAAWLDCTVEREIPAGDHTIVLLRIHAQTARPDTAPLVFHGSRFRTLAAV